MGKELRDIRVFVDIDDFIGLNKDNSVVLLNYIFFDSFYIKLGKEKDIDIYDQDKEIHGDITITKKEYLDLVNKGVEFITREYHRNKKKYKILLFINFNI